VKEDVLFHISVNAHESALATVVETLDAALCASTAKRIEVEAYAFTGWHLRHVSLARVALYELHKLAPAHDSDAEAVAASHTALALKVLGWRPTRSAP
jgi:hypothetical protein